MMAVEQISRGGQQQAAATQQASAAFDQIEKIGRNGTRGRRRLRRAHTTDRRHARLKSA